MKDDKFQLYELIVKHNHDWSLKIHMQIDYMTCKKDKERNCYLKLSWGTTRAILPYLIYFSHAKDNFVK